MKDLWTKVYAKCKNIVNSFKKPQLIPRKCAWQARRAHMGGKITKSIHHTRVGDLETELLSLSRNLIPLALPGQHIYTYTPHTLSLSLPRSFLLF